MRLLAFAFTIVFVWTGPGTTTRSANSGKSTGALSKDAMIFTRQDINNSRRNNQRVNNKLAVRFNTCGQRLMKVKVKKAWPPKASFFRARVASFRQLV